MVDVNELVMKLKEVEKGGSEYELLYSELFTIIYNDTIYPKVVGDFEKQLNGDISEGISVGSLLLMELVDKWTGEGSFHALYKKSLHNRLINLYHSFKQDVRKHNTSYEFSLSDSVSKDKESSVAVDILDDEKLVTTLEYEGETPSLESLLQKFKMIHPFDYGVIDLMISFPEGTKQNEKTNAYCVYFGKQEYTSALQRKVSRIREKFKKFIEANGYEMDKLNFIVR